MTEKYLGSNQSNNPEPVKDLVPVAKLPAPPGFATREAWEGFQISVKRAFECGLVPSSITTIAQAVTIALKGHELGLEPLYSLSQIYIVHGRPGLQAEVMRALVYRRYSDAEMVYQTPEERKYFECIIKCRRSKSESWQTFSFNMIDAQQAGVVTRQQNTKDLDMVKDSFGIWKASPRKEVWDKFRPNMLMARATSIAVRFLWPECVMGCQTPEELESIDVTPQPARETDDVDADFAAPEALLPGGNLTHLVAPLMGGKGEGEKISIKEVKHTGQIGIMEPNVTVVESAQTPDPISGEPADGKFPWKKPVVPRGTKKDASDFLIKLGVHVGKKIGDLPDDVALKYLRQLEERADKTNPGVIELIEKLRGHVLPEGG